MDSVIDEIAAERRRQIEVVGWSLEHDDEHDTGSLARAAACYANNAADMADGLPGDVFPAAHWPWDQRWWKPKGARRDLVRAAALIVAEIERLDRKAESALQSKGAPR